MPSLAKPLGTAVMLFALMLGGLGEPISPGSLGTRPAPLQAAQKAKPAKRHKSKVNKKALRHALHELGVARRNIARSRGLPPHARAQAQRATLQAMQDVRAMLRHK